MVLVYNPDSKSTLSARSLRNKCKAANIDIEKLIPLKAGFEQKLQPYVEEQFNIGVFGGDGTVSAVAKEVAGTESTLIPLPGGTLNHFTKDLDIPQNIDEALTRLKDAPLRKIDIGSVNGRIFINNSSLGLYPASLLEREEFESRVGKWTSAVIASLRALFRFRLYDITVDDKKMKTPFVFVGNNKYNLETIGGTVRTRLDQGVLTVFIAKTTSRRGLLKIILFALIGKANILPEFDTFYTRKLVIDTKRPTLHISYDGEISKMTSPLEYKIKKRALRIR